MINQTTDEGNKLKTSVLRLSVSGTRINCARFIIKPTVSSWWLFTFVRNNLLFVWFTFKLSIKYIYNIFVLTVVTFVLYILLIIYIIIYIYIILHYIYYYIYICYICYINILLYYLFI